jgi:hypothetical protein
VAHHTRRILANARNPLMTTLVKTKNNDRLDQ